MFQLDDVIMPYLVRKSYVVFQGLIALMIKDIYFNEVLYPLRFAFKALQHIINAFNYHCQESSAAAISLRYNPMPIHYRPYV